MCHLYSCYLHVQIQVGFRHTHFYVIISFSYDPDINFLHVQIYCHFAHISIYLSNFNCQCFNKHYIMLCRSVILYCHLFLFRMTMSGHVLMRDTLLQSTTLRIYSEYPCMYIYAVYSYHVLYLYVCYCLHMVSVRDRLKPCIYKLQFPSHTGYQSGVARPRACSTVVWSVLHIVLVKLRLQSQSQSNHSIQLLEFVVCDIISILWLRPMAHLMVTTLVAETLNYVNTIITFQPYK